MNLDDFLDILHDTAEFQTFGILTPENPSAENVTNEKNNQLRENFEEFLLNHGVIYHEIGGKFAGIDERSYLLENINYSDLEELSDDYRQFSFIHAVKNPEKAFGDVIYEKGDTKYNMNYYEKNDSSYQLDTTTSYILVNSNLTDGYSYFINQPHKKFSFRLFDNFIPEKSNYLHPWEPEGVLMDGVREETLETIREMINPSYRRRNR